MRWYKPVSILVLIGALLLVGQTPADAEPGGEVVRRTSAANAVTDEGTPPAEPDVGIAADTCGELGYDYVRGYSFAGGRALLEVWWNGSTDRNCLRVRTVGSAWGTGDWIGVAGGRWNQPTVYDWEPTSCSQAPFAGSRQWTAKQCSGSFEYWAGPITFSAPGCIDFLGAIKFQGSSTVHVIEGNRLHCGS